MMFNNQILYAIIFISLCIGLDNLTSLSTQLIVNVLIMYINKILYIVIKFHYQVLLPIFSIIIKIKIKIEY